MSMISVTRSVSLAALTAIVLVGCSRGGGVTLGGGGDQAKLNAYTDGYNIVIGEFGLKQQFDAYEKAGIGGPHPEPEFVFLGGGWLDQARAKLQAGWAKVA